MDDCEEFSKIAQTRLEAGFIALDEAGPVREEMGPGVRPAARIGLYSPELCGDAVALRAIFEEDLKRRFKTEWRGLFGFEDAVGHRLRSQYWQKTGTTKLAKNHQPGTSAIVHTMV
jgi:hypothetical protein